MLAKIDNFLRHLTMLKSVPIYSTIIFQSIDKLIKNLWVYTGAYTKRRKNIFRRALGFLKVPTF